MKRIAILLLVVALCGGAVSAPRAAAAGRASVFTGFGFDACTAPQSLTMSAWLASPYRAIGIYIGGINRACPDGNLTPSWIAGVQAIGWNLIPLYVGQQAPCLAHPGAKIAAASAGAQGTAAADDAAGRAALFALPPGAPIYFDMEGYPVGRAACTKAVQDFVAGWVSELHLLGFVAGVYGSAASTIRDLTTLPDGSRPDDVWIANWNGQTTLFGDRYVTDSVWTNHQRLHQYKGGHRETYGNVTLNVDSSAVDAAVVAPPVPAPPPTPPSVGFPAGSVASGDGRATVSWPDGAFAQPVAVTLQASVPAQAPAGFGPGYAVRLAVAQSGTNAPVTSFAAPLDVHFGPPSQPAVPLTSSDGATWTAVPAAAVTRGSDGSIDIRTTAPGFFGLFPDTAPPAAPAVTGRFLKGALRLSWPPAGDNSGAVASYHVDLDGTPRLSTPGGVTRAVVRAFHRGGPSVYTVVAVDAVGNVSPPSAPVTVVPAPRPAGVPRAFPRWAWKLLAWQQHRRAGPRPAAPRPLPSWYWRWASWRAQPFRIER